MNLYKRIKNNLKESETIGDLLEEIDNAYSVGEIESIGRRFKNEMDRKTIEDEVNAIEEEYGDVYEMNEDSDEYASILDELKSCISSDFSGEEENINESEKLNESYAIINYWDSNGEHQEKIINGSSPKNLETKVKRFVDKVDEFNIIDISQASNDVADSEYLNSLGEGVLRTDTWNSTFEESEDYETNRNDIIKQAAEYIFYDIDGDYDVELPSYEEFTNTYMDLNKRDFNKAVELVDKALDNYKEHSYYDRDVRYKGPLLELSDNHTIWELDNPSLENDDNAWELWDTIVTSKFDDFKEETGEELYGCGRSGRHICVEPTLKNCLNFDKLQEVQERLEQAAIEEYNNYRPEEFNESEELDQHLIDLVTKKKDLLTDDIIDDDLAYDLIEKIDNELINSYSIEEIEKAEKLVGLDESEKLNESDEEDARKISIGLNDAKSKDIINAVIGQMSDGHWENSPGMERYWRFASGLDDQGNIIVYTGSDRKKEFAGYDRYGLKKYKQHWTDSAFNNMSDEAVKKFFANKIKQIVKLEGLDWNRNNTEPCEYLDYNSGVTVRDAYKVYDRLLGRIDRITDSEKLKELKIKVGDEIEFYSTGYDKNGKFSNKPNILMKTKVTKVNPDGSVSAEDPQGIKSFDYISKDEIVSINGKELKESDTFDITNKIRDNVGEVIRKHWSTIYSDEWFDKNDLIISLPDNYGKQEVVIDFKNRKEPYYLVNSNELKKLKEDLKSLGLKGLHIKTKTIKPDWDDRKYTEVLSISYKDNNSINESGPYYIGPKEYCMITKNDEDSDLLSLYLDDNKYTEEVIPKNWSEDKIRKLAGKISNSEGPRGDRDFVKEVEQESLNESDTEDKWDATELDRVGFMALLKFNHPEEHMNPSMQYIITNDGNEVYRFAMTGEDERTKDIGAKLEFRRYINKEESEKVLKESNYEGGYLTSDKFEDMTDQELLDYLAFVKEEWLYHTTKRQEELGNDIDLIHKILVDRGVLEDDNNPNSNTIYFDKDGNIVDENGKLLEKVYYDDKGNIVTEKV